MANKKKNSEAAPTPEQQARAASSSRKKQRKTYVSKTVKIVLVVIGVLAMLFAPIALFLMLVFMYSFFDTLNLRATS